MSRTHDTSLGGDDDVYEREAYACIAMHLITVETSGKFSFVADLVERPCTNFAQTLDLWQR